MTMQGTMPYVVELEDVRQRNDMLAAESARLAALCNELVFQLVLNGVQIPHSASESLPLDAASWPAALDLSSGPGPLPPRAAGSMDAAERLLPAKAPEGILASSARLVDDEAVFLACESSSGRLRALKLSQSIVTDEGVAIICQSLPGLQELDLSGCAYITDACLAMVASSLPELRVLDLSHTCMGTGVGRLAKLPSLAILRLNGCAGVHDDALEPFERRGSSASRALLQLAVAGTGTGDGTLARVIRTHVNLVAVDVSGTDAATATGEAIGKLRAVRAVRAAGCARLDETGVLKLAAAKGLSSLCIAECPGVTDRALEAVLSLGGLTHLDLGAVGPLNERLKIPGRGRVSWGEEHPTWEGAAAEAEEGAAGGEGEGDETSNPPSPDRLKPPATAPPERAHISFNPQPPQRHRLNTGGGGPVPPPLGSSHSTVLTLSSSGSGSIMRGLETEVKKMRVAGFQRRVYKPKDAPETHLLEEQEGGALRQHRRNASRARKEGLQSLVVAGEGHAAARTGYALVGDAPPPRGHYSSPPRRVVRTGQSVIRERLRTSQERDSMYRAHEEGAGGGLGLGAGVGAGAEGGLLPPIISHRSQEGELEKKERAGRGEPVM